MESEILESMKHIKNISKNTNVKKRNLTITYEDLWTYVEQRILDKMVIDNILRESESGVSRTYLIPEDPYKILVTDTQDISRNSNNNLLFENILEETNLEQSTQEDTNVKHDNILNDIKSFNKFQAEVESNFFYWSMQLLQEKRPKTLQMTHQDL